MTTQRYCNHCQKKTPHTKVTKNEFVCQTCADLVASVFKKEEPTDGKETSA